MRPLTSSGATSSSSIASFARLRANGPIRISPGAADCCSRAARLTASPVANVESVESTTTSPASIPTRASSPRLLTASRIPSPARIARSASSSCACGDAECCEHRVAGELLDDPAVRGHAVRDVIEEPRHAAADDLRIAGSDERRRIDEIDEQDRCKLALHASSVETNQPGIESGRSRHWQSQCLRSWSPPSSLRHCAGPHSFQGLRRPRPLSEPTRRGRCAGDRAGLRGAVRARSGSPSAATCGSRRPRWRLR